VADSRTTRKRARRGELLLRRAASRRITDDPPLRVSVEARPMSPSWNDDPPTIEDLIAEARRISERAHAVGETWEVCRKALHQTLAVLTATFQECRGLPAGSDEGEGQGLRLAPTRDDDNVT